MQILSPDTIRKDRAARDEETRRRVHFLADEEARLVKSVNDLRALEKEELRKKAEREAARQMKLAETKTQLEEEVATLENRKREAMTPVNELRDRLQDEFTKAQAQNEHLKVLERELIDAKDDYLDKLEALKDRETAQNERKEHLDRRERGIVASEAQVTQSTTLLNDKWVVYHEEVTKLNAKIRDIQEREARVAMDEQANKIYKETLDKRQLSLKEKERGIVDGYATLEAARKEVLEGKLQ